MLCTQVAMQWIKLKEYSAKILESLALESRKVEEKLGVLKRIPSFLDPAYI